MSCKAETELLQTHKHTHTHTPRRTPACFDRISEICCTTCGYFACLVPSTFALLPERQADKLLDPPQQQLMREPQLMLERPIRQHPTIASDSFPELRLRSIL